MGPSTGDMATSLKMANFTARHYVSAIYAMALCQSSSMFGLHVSWLKTAKLRDLLTVP